MRLTHMRATSSRKFVPTTRDHIISKGWLEKSFVPSLSGTHKIFLDEPPMVLTNAFVVVGSGVDYAQRVIHAADSARLRGGSKKLFIVASMADMLMADMFADDPS